MMDVEIVANQLLLLYVDNRRTRQDEDKEREQPHMKRASIEEILEAEERLNAKGSASVREQWDFDVSSS